MNETGLGLGEQPNIQMNRISRVGMQQYDDMHLLHDNELDKLHRPEAGWMSSLGSTAAGVFLGLFPQAWGAVQSAEKSLSASEWATILLCTMALPLAAALLVLAAIASAKGKTEIKKIRARKKFVVPSIRFPSTD